MSDFELVIWVWVAAFVYIIWLDHDEKEKNKM